MMDWPKRQIPHSRWLTKQDGHFSRSSSDFADHFRTKYAGFHPPVWIAKEAWDWGAMSHLLNGLKGKFQGEVADYFGYSSGKHIGSWVKSLNTLRNDCAHHARVWNRGYSLQPMLPKLGDIPELDHLHNLGSLTSRLYPIAAILFYLCRQTYPNTALNAKFRSLVISQAPSDPLINRVRAGFPDNWDQLPLWN